MAEKYAVMMVSMDTSYLCKWDGKCYRPQAEGRFTDLLEMAKELNGEEETQDGKEVHGTV